MQPSPYVPTHSINIEPLPLCRLSSSLLTHSCLLTVHCFFISASSLSLFVSFHIHPNIFTLFLNPSSEYNISAAAIAIFSLFFMILGTLCVIFSFGKGRDYLLRPAGMFFAFAGQIWQIKWFTDQALYGTLVFVLQLKLKWGMSLSSSWTPLLVVMNITYAANLRWQALTDLM